MRFRMMLLMLMGWVFLWGNTLSTLADVDDPELEDETTISGTQDAPSVELLISPTEVAIDSGRNTFILVTVRNNSSVPIHNLRPGCVADESVGMCKLSPMNAPKLEANPHVFPSQIAPYSSVSTEVTIIRPDGAIFDGGIIIYLQYDYGENGQTDVIQKLVQLTHQEIEAPLIIRIETVDDSISDWTVFDVFVSIENTTDTPVTIRDVDVHLPSRRSRDGDKNQLDWRHPMKTDGTLIIGPRRTYTNWLQLSFTDENAVAPGSYLLGLRVKGSWKRNGIIENSYVATTHPITIGVHADETLASLLEVPLVFMPGIVAMTIIVVLLKALTNLELKLTVTENAITSIPISIGIVVIYNLATQSMVPYAYNFTDVQWILMLGVGFGIGFSIFAIVCNTTRHKETEKQSTNKATTQ